MYESFGKLIHSGNRSVVEIDNGLTEFYRALIPKSQKWNRPRYQTHITVVRTGIEKVDPALWGYGDGRKITFTYDPYIWIGKKYIFLDVFCEELVNIRSKLGLSGQFIPHPLGMNYSCFHITIANMKFL